MERIAEQAISNTKRGSPLNQRWISTVNLWDDTSVTMFKERLQRWIVPRMIPDEKIIQDSLRTVFRRPNVYFSPRHIKSFLYFFTVVLYILFHNVSLSISGKRWTWHLDMVRSSQFLPLGRSFVTISVSDRSFVPLTVFPNILYKYFISTHHDLSISGSAHYFLLSNLSRVLVQTMRSFFSFILLASVSWGRNSIIGFPRTGYTVDQGSNVIVQVQRPVSCSCASLKCKIRLF